MQPAHDVENGKAEAAMEHRIRDGDVVRLSELLDWYKEGMLRQSRSATRIWLTVQFTRPKTDQAPGARNIRLDAND